MPEPETPEANADSEACVRFVHMTDPHLTSLEAVLMHHINPVASLYGYDETQAVLPSRPDLDAIDFVVMNDRQAMDAIASSNECSIGPLKKRDLQDLIAFLHALTDPRALDMRTHVPASVPSGLPVRD